MQKNLAPAHAYMQHIFRLKRSQKMWNTSTWALHEIKRINPCNMHDEFHEYVEGKKKGL